MQLDWTLLLGPGGALVFAVVVCWRLWSKLSAVEAVRDQEHAARLADAKEYARTLLEVAEGTHRAIDRLEERSGSRRMNGTSPRV